LCKSAQMAAYLEVTGPSNFGTVQAIQSTRLADGRKSKDVAQRRTPRRLMLTPFPRMRDQLDLAWLR
jgi:hypothetical protein